MHLSAQAAAARRPRKICGGAGGCSLASGPCLAPVHIENDGFALEVLVGARVSGLASGVGAGVAAASRPVDNASRPVLAAGQEGSGGTRAGVRDAFQ